MFCNKVVETPMPLSWVNDWLTYCTLRLKLVYVDSLLYSRLKPPQPLRHNTAAAQQYSKVKVFYMTGQSIS